VGFATAIVEEMRKRGLFESNPTQVIPILSSQFPTLAERPHNSRLSNQKLSRVFGVSLPPWRESLVSVMDELTNELLMPAKA